MQSVRFSRVRLPPEKIVLIRMRGNLAEITAEDGSYTLRQTLQSIERALAGGSFLPLVGVHTYALYCRWSRPPEEPGGSGSCTYVLLIDGE